MKKSEKLWMLLPAAAILCMVVLGVLYRDQLTPEVLLHASPKSPFLAALFLLALYVFKCLSFVFPIVVLFALGGMLFPPVAAVFVNLLGTAIALSIPFWIGHCMGSDLMQSLRTKFPAVNKLAEFQGESPAFLSFFLRVVGVLPFDVISLYLGAMGQSYLSYLLPALAGMAPGLIAATLLGTSLSDPASPLFIGSVIMTVALSLASALAYRWYHLHRAKKQSS